MAASGKPFTKGDPRINRNGRPKSFDALQKLAQSIAHETAKAGNDLIVIKGHAVTVAEMILRQWAQSKNPQLQQKFIEIAFGKTPDTVHLDASVASVGMTLSEWKAQAEERRRAVAETLAEDGDE